MNETPITFCVICDNPCTLHAKVCGEPLCATCYEWQRDKKTAVAVPSDPKGTMKYEVEATKTPWEIYPLTDPKGAAGKLKDQLQLIPTILNRETAKALAHGADKYGDWNWRVKKVQLMTYAGAMKRHIDLYIDGLLRDDDSGAHQLGCVSANCAILMDAEDQGTLIDNRPVNNKTKKQ